MEKLLITLRHPGPADAIIPIINRLKNYYEPILLVTDSAIPFISDRFPSVFQEITTYVPSSLPKTEFVKGTSSKRSFKTEFFNNEFEEYAQFYKIFEAFIERIKPTIALRTTPAWNWGIDEILPTAMFRVLGQNNTKCYQEYYGVGNGIRPSQSQMVAIIPPCLATVDESAVALLKKESVSSKAIGWLSHQKFLTLEPYRRARKKARSSLNIQKNDKVILYAAVSCGEIQQEISHFKIFLETFANIIKSIPKDKTLKTFLKLHPRTTLSERALYLDIINSKKLPINLIEKRLPYHWLLSFPDVVYSSASAFNIDAMAYQCTHISIDEYYSQIKEAECTISTYTSDKISSYFVKKATGHTIIPTHQKKSGHIVIEESNIAQILMAILSDPILFFDELTFAWHNYNQLGNTVEKLINYLENN